MQNPRHLRTAEKVRQPEEPGRPERQPRKHQIDKRESRYPVRQALVKLITKNAVVGKQQLRFAHVVPPLPSLSLPVPAPPRFPREGPAPHDLSVRTAGNV